MPNFFNARDKLVTSGESYTFYRLDRLERDGLVRLNRLPYSIRILLESLLRQCNEREITRQDVINLAGWQPVPAPSSPDESAWGERVVRPSIPFRPGRVIMQDFTGVPAVVDLAAMRATVARMGGAPEKINPLVPVDLVVDHSVQVDFFASPDALQRNADLEFQRNRERYEFLRWGQKAFANFRVVPPATGIVHQVNLEYLAQVVMTNAEDEAFPDTLVGTDSHTTMINGLGVVGWGVGGIEAEAAMLGQPIDLVAPDVIGFKLHGEPGEGLTATDIVLTITQMLRNKGVVDKFVEFYGAGLSALSLPDRATIANMAPEYGATIGFFPVDDETMRYLRLTGRSEQVIERVERYCKEQGLFRTAETPDPLFTDILELDLSTVEPSLAGPKRPQDRVALADMPRTFRAALTAPVKDRGYELPDAELDKKASIGTNGSRSEIGHGAVVIAAITSCTNTSNPSVMVAAGLVAKKAVERGLKSAPYVKTSLAPGSRVVTEYLQKAGLLEPLAQIGFNIVGYGCTTCIGNSGPLSGEIVKAVAANNLVTAAVLSGNRNFEGRVHPTTRANYLASPPLVVAYALAGRVDIDFVNEPIGRGKDGQPVFLREIWPTTLQVAQVVAESVSADMFRQKYANVFSGNETWNAIPVSEGQLYEWNEKSTYIQEPPFFEDFSTGIPHIQEIHGARVLAFLGDSITTDHISPAGNIAADSPAGKFLIAHGIQARDFNSYGSRRGNDRVMTRGTFANIRLKNRLVPGVEGGVTVFFPDGERVSIFDAAEKYRQTGVPTLVLAGKEYGTGSSRDWAAKGPRLLGVKAVLAESFERIHRSNLIGMGVLPLVYQPGQNADSLGLTGEETFDITGLSDQIAPQNEVIVTAHKPDGTVVSFRAIARLNTAVEVEYYRNGGVLNTVLRRMLGKD
jgi:aconitate hydratase A / 2-methylisocitrate dehydratase